MSYEEVNRVGYSQTGYSRIFWSTSYLVYWRDKHEHSDFGLWNDGNDLCA